MNAFLRAALFAWIPLGALFIAPRGALAYCRQSTCKPVGARCVPEQPSDCGLTLSWNRTCLGFTTQEDGSATIPAETARAILGQAFATWQAADCGTGHPGVELIDMGLVACNTAEYSTTTGNANILIFRDHDWPYPGGEDNVALTTVSFDRITGQIDDADIEVNTAEYQITTDPKNPEYDLLAVLTHETGHFLGLAHSADGLSTMSPGIIAGTLDHRALDADDVAGICATFPPAPVDNQCNPIPRHGFSALCKSDQQPVSCGVPRAPVPWSGELAFGAALMASWALRRRTRQPSWE